MGKGSGIVLGAGNAFPKTLAKLQRPDLAPPNTRTLELVDFGRHLVEDDIDPPLRALFIYNDNPIVVHPDQNRMHRGLARDDILSVGIEVAMTESMAQCDIILPAATHFECFYSARDRRKSVSPLFCSSSTSAILLSVLGASGWASQFHRSTPSR